MGELSKVSYSVVIRTLGNGGEKYKRLLESIKSQTIQPEQIIVAIPEGYSLDFSLGSESILRATKGMVSQRAEGILSARSRNILVVDDDIEFGPSFVEELDGFMNTHHLDCVLPMEGKDDCPDSKRMNLWYSFPRRIRSGFTGQMFQTRKKSDYLDTITITAGHKVFCNSNIKDRCYYCQTGNFQCFYIDTGKAKNVHFENEIWLQQGSISSYSSYDDPAFFYHFYLQGNTIAYALRTRYVHLDSGSGRVAHSKLESKCIRYFTIARNRTFFWYRFLFQTSTSFVRRSLVVFGGLYAFINYTLYTMLINVHPKYWKAIKALWTGYKEAWLLISSKSIKPLEISYEQRVSQKK